MQSNATFAARNIDQRELVGVLHNTLADRESEREVSQIRRRRRHHRERQTVVEQGDRDFLDHPFFADCTPTIGEMQRPAVHD